MKKNSIVVRLNKKKESELIISNQDIKFITKHKDVNPAVLGAVVFVLVIIVLSAEGMSIGPSATK